MNVDINLVSFLEGKLLFHPDGEVAQSPKVLKQLA